MEPVFLALGSNLGDRAANLRLAVSSLLQKAELVAVSSIYETKPVGFLEQPLFLNAACLIRTSMEPLEILDWLKGIESSIGPRAPLHNGPRAADIDILLYGDLVLDTPRLTIPHPRLAERAFVLVPLAEIAPDLLHPVLKMKVADLLRELKKPCGVEKWHGQLLAEA